MKQARRFALIVAALACQSAIASAQTHVFKLNGTLSDEANTASLVSLGGTLTGPGYIFGVNQGLTLSNVFSAGSSYSIVMRSYFDQLSGYHKMVDFKNNTTDAGAYALGTAPNVFPVGSGASGTYADGVLAVTVFTRDASTSMFNTYVNGSQQITFNDAGGLGDFSGANGIARFFVDDCGTCVEAGSGYVDYIATYDYALTGQEVASLELVESAAPEPASAVLLATGLLAIAASGRRLRRRVQIAATAIGRRQAPTHYLL